jgi:ATP-binding cassette subfamily B protein
MFDMRMQIFRKLQTLDVSFFDRNPVGRLMTRLTNDVETLNEMFTSGVVAIFWISSRWPASWWFSCGSTGSWR